LADSGIKVIASTWDNQKRSIAPLLPKEIHHLSKWSGPRSEQWHEWVPPNEAPPNSWLMSNEMPPELGPGSNRELIEFAKSRKLNSAVTFFDAIPVILPELYPPGSAELHYSYMNQLAEWDLIFPISIQSANDMLDLLPQYVSTKYDLSKKLIPIPLPGVFASTETRSYLPTSLKSRPLILVLSTFEQRKNHISLLRAAAIAHRSLPFGFELILVGHALDHGVVELVQRYKKVFPKMKIVHDASDDQIRDWLDRADFTIFPSIEEGFGLPIFESLSRGKPVICDNQRAIDEISRDGGCLQIDVLNIEQFAEAIVTLATDFEIYQSKCKEIKNRSFRTWENYISDIVTSMSNSSALS
jgi:glycosyltransferase involved in cell wall biosynthesis